MLHVTTEVGKPGIREREKRHFPNINNQKSILGQFHPHGRKYIPHGYGVYREWRAHPQNIQMEYTEAGPDWSSRLKYIPDPENPRYPAAEIFENNWHAMRPYPYTYMRTKNEWLLDPDARHGGGIRTSFQGQHQATRTSNKELTHQMLFGRGRNGTLVDQRNGIAEASPGDKSYQVPEYSPGFHHLGSSLPLVEFGAPNPRQSGETFIPLQGIPQTPRETYRNRELKRKKNEEVSIVQALDTWRPATPLKVPQPEEKK